MIYASIYRSFLNLFSNWQHADVQNASKSFSSRLCGVGWEVGGESKEISCTVFHGHVENRTEISNKAPKYQGVHFISYSKERKEEFLGSYTTTRRGFTTKKGQKDMPACPPKFHDNIKA